MTNVLVRIAAERNLDSYSRFRVAYCQAAHELGQRNADLSRRQHLRWTRGDMKALPRAAACEVLERMFGVPVAVLFSQDRRTQKSPAEPSNRTSSDASSPPASEDARSLEELLRAGAGRARRQAELAGANISDYALEQAHADTRRLAGDYMDRSPAELIVEVHDTRELVFDMLDRTRRPQQITDLMLLAGILSGLFAQLCIDLGHERSATEHALAAWTFGQTIGHNGLAGWGRGMQATVAFWDRRPRDAIASMQRAEQYVTSGPMAVRAASLTARAWSHNGNINQTVLAVRRAEELASTAAGNDDLSDGIGGLLRWDTTRREMCAASAYVQLLCLLRTEIDREKLIWLADQVVHHASRALASSERAPHQGRSIALETSMRLDMATAAIILGDHDRVRDALADLFELPDQRRTYPLLYRTGHASAVLSAIRDPWARELTDEMRHFTAKALLPATPTLPVVPGQLALR
ncbi:hypothetical protein [Actinomadura gamaensis]|uniref:XRE family transcriptional regulator n=1 Tax=Actinomadura gamaensis TaxID=1763541 RepID=A0ABV9TS08_9ACTN